MLITDYGSRNCLLTHTQRVRASPVGFNKLIIVRYEWFVSEKQHCNLNEQVLRLCKCTKKHLIIREFCVSTKIVGNAIGILECANRENDLMSQMTY